MARHFLTLYSVRFTHSDGDDRPLGNIDGNGTSVVQVIESVLDGDLPHHDPDRERVLDYAGNQGHPDVLLETYLFRYGEYGVRFDVTEAVDLEAVNYPATVNESRVAILAAALLAPADQEQGWLITHSIGRTMSMVTHLKGVLAVGIRERGIDGRLQIDPAQSAEAWELMLEQGSVTGLMFHVSDGTIGDDDLVPGVDLEEFGHFDLVIRPHRGIKFKRDAARAVRQLAEQGELMIFRNTENGAAGIEPDSATIEVLFRGSRRRLDVDAGDEEAPVKIPRLETSTRPPDGDTTHDWMRDESLELLGLLGLNGA